MSKLKTVRMRDVAARCGVAESTVSHVINGTKFVAPATKEKIEQALREMNFHRDSHARRLARGHSNFLGLIISDIENPFYPGLIKAFESAALAQGFEVLLCATNYDATRTDDAFRKMIENKSPGVAVMTSRVDPKMAKYLADHGVASVFLDSGDPGPRKSDIRVDYRKGVTAAVRYLHHLGHRDFALIAGPLNRASHLAYRHAMEAALTELQLKARIVEGNNDEDTGAAAVQRLLATERFPTAILCSNDVTAMGATRALFKCGLRVPTDVSVVGADDIPFAALTQPPLTTVQMPRERLGTLALELLQELLGKKSGKGKAVVLDTELVIRESTGSAQDNTTAAASSSAFASR
ncbi:MAG: LacI family DNA-binding transcriptional regulator [Roseimicrobium sp.]